MTSANYTAPEGASPLIEQKPFVTYNRSLVCGIGVNDLMSPVKVDGKIIKSYDTWGSMLKRCYSSKYQKDKPTYVGCSVAEEWYSFTNYKNWFDSNYVEGWHLDKDLLVPGNRVYGPDTCVFVPQEINHLLLDHRSARGAWPLGVTFHKPNQKYIAAISEGACRRNLGSFLTPLAAHRAWQLAKTAAIETAETDNPRVRASLDLRAAKLRDDHANGRITTKL